MDGKIAHLLVTIALAHVFANSGFADDLNMNKWEDVITLRMREGAKPSKECSQSWCDSITTLPADQYGTILQTIEATGTVTGRWECTIDKGSSLRSCNGFWPKDPWRLDQRDANGKFVLLKIGIFDEIHNLEKSIWRSEVVPTVSSAPSVSQPAKSVPEKHFGTGPFGDEVPVDGLPLDVLQKIYLQLDDVCRGESSDHARIDAFCDYRGGKQGHLQDRFLPSLSAIYVAPVQNERPETLVMSR